jgi:hypothetical protein
MVGRRPSGVGSAGHGSAAHVAPSAAEHKSAQRTAEDGRAVVYDLAGKPENDLDDYVQLFFEPRSTASWQAATELFARLALRQTNCSIPVSGEWVGVRFPKS